MSIRRFQNLITSDSELELLYGLPSELVTRKQLCELDEHMRSFIAQAPFLLIGTVDEQGNCDVSPRGDFPSVARVLDSTTLVIADRPGNRRTDTLRNILQTGRAGLLFMIPGQGETVRVNGKACVFRDKELLEPFSVQSKCPPIGIGLEVEECYFQCAKAIIRSKIWSSPDEHVPVSMCSFARILIDQTKTTSETEESLARHIEESYRNRLY